MYRIATIDVKGDGATYEAANRDKVLEHVKRLLEHGRKYVGDKIVEIHITSGHKKERPLWVRHVSGTSMRPIRQ